MYSLREKLACGAATFLRAPRSCGTSLRCVTFEPLERRQLLSSPAPDLAQSAAQLSAGRLDLVAAIAGDDALFAGGIAGIGSGPPTDRVDIYDASTRAWSTGALSEPKVGLAATTLGVKAFFAGGTSITSRDATSNVVDVFDASDAAWSVAHLSAPRSQLSATSVAGKALFAGGRTVSGVSDVVDIYDGETGVWTTAELSVARYGMSAFTVGHLAIFAGGTTTTDGEAPAGSNIDIYDADTGGWGVSFLNGYAILGGAVLAAKAYIAVTAEGSTTSASQKTLTYDAITNRWSTLSAPAGAGAIASVGVKVLFGDDSSVDTYNVATGQWYSNPVSPDHGRGATITVGDNVLLAGGASASVNIPIGSFAVDKLTDTAPATELAGGVVGHHKGRATVTVSNTGDAPLAGPYTVQVYAIPPRQYHGAILLGSVPVSAGLAAGDSVRVSVPLTLPAGTLAGTYHYVAMVKAADGTLTPFAGGTATFTVAAAASPARATPAAAAFAVKPLAAASARHRSWLADA